jgi:RNA polymerase sigma factor (sigma-70 family)
MDPGLLEDLWTSHLRLFRHIAYAILRHTDYVDEVTQEAFVRALKSKTLISTPEEALLYLKKVVTNVSIDHYHRRRRQLQDQDLQMADRVSELGSSSPLRQVVRSEEESLKSRRLQEIMREIESLPPEQRLVIDALVLSESPPTLAALSQSTGVPSSTLKSRLNNGLDKIRKNLRKKNLWEVM